MWDQGFLKSTKLTKRNETDENGFLSSTKLTRNVNYLRVREYSLHNSTKILAHPLPPPPPLNNICISISIHSFISSFIHSFIYPFIHLFIIHCICLSDKCSVITTVWQISLIHWYTLTNAKGTLRIGYICFKDGSTTYVSKTVVQLTFRRRWYNLRFVL